MISYAARWHWPAWAFVAVVGGSRRARGDVVGFYAARVRARYCYRWLR